MLGKTTFDSPLGNVASGIEERRCGLIGRHKYLRDKIATMERSIPALMAYTMWMANERDGRVDASCRRVQEIVNKLSPQPDPADELLAELRGTVHDLRQETAQLHDKIIDADVKLEETAMELESLELINKEMEEKLVGLRSEVQRHSTPSLHSIHSEDLICLKKIRQLAEEEFRLKSCIKELKGKETMYRRQMRQLLTCKKFQCDSGKPTERAQKLEGKDGEIYRLLESCKCNVHAIEKKYAVKDKEQKTCCSCPISIIAYEQTPKRSREKTRRLSSGKKLCPPPSCCIPLDNSHATRATADHKFPSCKISCAPCQSSISISTSRPESPHSTIPPCDSRFGTVPKTDVSRSLKQIIHSSVPCEPGKTCDACEISASCKQIGICRCTCEEKCAHELSNVPCNCDVTQSIPTDKAAYKSKASDVLYSRLETDDSNSDEEFCECCSCGCEVSENSS